MAIGTFLTYPYVTPYVLTVDNLFDIYDVKTNFAIFQKTIRSLPVQINANKLVKDGETEQAYYLPVGVYYEALCPDSRNFILQHLQPSFDKAPNSFDIQFVPYGKAKVM